MPINRKYTLNEQYFNKINNKDKAYFLGLLYADGSVSSVKNTVKIALQSKDVELLKKLNHLIGSNRPLCYQKPKKMVNTKYTSNGSYCLYIDSAIIKRDLINLGCTPNKSFSIRFPIEDQLPKKYYTDFIRGFFDGDGCITRVNTNCVCGALFFSNEEFLIALKNVLFNLLQIEFKISPHKGIFSLSIYRRENVLRFGDMLYNRANLFLERKKEKFIGWKKFDKNAREKKRRIIARMAYEEGKRIQYIQELSTPIQDRSEIPIAI